MQTNNFCNVSILCKHVFFVHTKFYQQGSRKFSSSTSLTFHGNMFWFCEKDWFEFFCSSKQMHFWAPFKQLFSQEFRFDSTVIVASFEFHFVHSDCRNVYIKVDPSVDRSAASPDTSYIHFWSINARGYIVFQPIWRCEFIIDAHA